MKYIIAFVCLFSCFLLSNTATTYTYRPMTQKTINFGDDVCYYEDISNDSHFAYVKPCEEGKECVALSSSLSDYAIAICQERSNEEYDNEGLTCETKAYLLGLDCTGYSCNSESKCYNTCAKNKVYDYKNNNCIDDPSICYEYEYDNANGLPTNQYLTNPNPNTPDNQYKNMYSIYGNKQCVQLQLVETKNTDTIYQVSKKLTNYVASIDDGNYIEDDEYYLVYCKSGYALYFFGNGKLENPNNGKNSEKLYLRCVTVLGKDKNGIIKYKIGEGNEKFYNPRILSNHYPRNKELPGNDEHLMLKLGFFKNYKERLDKLGCRETGDCEDYELCKWKYFYYNPEEYYLYQNEPQVLEYLMQDAGCRFKPKHTSSNGSNYLSNIKYLTLLSLLLLF